LKDYRLNNNGSST